MAKKMTKSNAPAVVSRLMNLYRDEVRDGGTAIHEAMCEMLTSLATDNETGPGFRAELNQVLEDLADADVFGTEGQLDPRGDGRKS